MRSAIFSRALLLSAALLFSMVMSYGQDNPGDLLVGKWIKSMNGASASFIITAENKYEVEMTGDETPDVYGSCVIEGNQITFTDEGGDYSSDSSGVYEFKAEDKSLTFSIVDDPVNGRSMLVEGTWTRASEEE